MKKNMIFLLMLIISSLLYAQAPKNSIEAKKEAEEKIEGIRKDILAGKIDFATAAISYSNDSTSGSKGGSLGKVKRGMMTPAFEEVAFKIKEKVVSEVFETDFGYHILMVDAKHGDAINVRHILIIPRKSK